MKSIVFYYLFARRSKGVAILLGCCLIIFMSCSADRSSDDFDGEPLPDVVDFNQHVRGILSDTCFACHGPDAMTREAGLRLDTDEGAFSKLEGDPGRFVIVPGRPQESEVYLRIISDDPDYVMPTPTSNLNLTDREIALIKRWIEQGAEYQPHWALIPPEKHEIPDVVDTEWLTNEIDAFILEKIEEAGWEPSPQADRETLLRRVSFDLTGLPPTVEEIEDFLADDSPDAYERVVDRLLASQAFGERMATEWLDVARYADTHGYQDDGPNEMWPWREWVIDAFNRNMPFDQFATWQLAGDLMSDATREQKLATGFGRLHQQNQEGGIIGEEYRVEYVADRVQTTGTAFLGMTMQCARCHDHKYDPISEIEYYEFGAFFDNINDTGQIPNFGAAGPTILLPDDETEQLIGYLEEQIALQQQQLEDLQDNKTDDFSRWQSQTAAMERSLQPESDGLIVYLDLNDIRGDSVVTVRQNGENVNGRISGRLNLTEGVNGTAIEFNHGNYINLQRIARFERTDAFSFSFWIHPSGTFNEVPVLVKTGDIFIGHRGYDVSLFENRVSIRLVHGWPYNSIQVLTQDSLSIDRWSHVAVTYDGSNQAAGIAIYIDGQKQELHIEQDKLFKQITPDDPDHDFDFLIGERRSFENLSYQGMKLDEIKIFNRWLSPVEVLALAARQDELDEIFTLAPDELNSGQKEILFEHFLYNVDTEVQNNLGRLEKLRAELSSVTDTLREVMVMEERLNPRTSYVRERGMYDQLGEEVSPGVPESIMTFPEDLPRNRLGLARWLLSEENPLTSRVVVNRYWQMLFGVGLVDTPDDFGNQGSLPSHPELLDWLAVTFRENGWDVKNLLRQIVMSSTYRQSSITTPEMRDRDPVNRLLAHGPRYRLTAEMIRDNALAASGLLVEKIGGPSVMPYQPEGLWEETTSGRHLTTYVQDSGESLYRRSLYTFWKRTVPPPGMTTFDAAMRTHPTVHREHTSTPLQALHTLNDPIYVEASRLLAERMIKEGGETLEDQISFAFRVATSRYPSDRELGLLAGLYSDELTTYREKPGLADELLSVGEYPADPDLDPAEVAARTIVASAIFNLDETLTKQ